MQIELQKRTFISLTQKLNKLTYKHIIMIFYEHMKSNIYCCQ